ncbi:MAG: hypothetical protein DRR42_22095 [Gammaproteobacteria bacterium]|nr:MAG: hypothetical protein DRR42_22095 [Gammaproteobacteria bacterium]
MINLKNLIKGTIPFVALTSISPVQAIQVLDPLPTPNCGTTQANNCVQFGDFSVYSLGLLNVQAEYEDTGTIPTQNPTPGDPYYVKSAPGELGLDGYIVYGTGTNNKGVVTNGDGDEIDDAQEQPNGSSSSTFTVSNITETDPDFTSIGDIDSSWSGLLSAVRSELDEGSYDDGKFVIYFNLNETGSSTVDPDNTAGLAPIDLLAWFHVTLIDLDVGGLAPVDYYLTGAVGSPTPTDKPSAITDDEWVTVHGTICVSATAGFLGFGECSDAQKVDGGVDVNQNLGANTAAFAMYNEDLSNKVLDSAYDVIHGEWMFAEINNGYEQEFSALTPFDGPRREVPEPGTLLLLGLGLAGIGYRRHKIA